MGIILLIIFVSISYLIIRIGTVALEMTGMERSKALFQAVSAFTSTGFTTRDAERVVNHPRRRKVIIILMVLGNAGIVSVISSFILSVRPVGTIHPSFNLLIVAASLFVLYRIASQNALAKKVTEKIRSILREKLHFESVKVEELLTQPGGHGVAAVLVGKESRVAGLSLINSGFREHDLMVLSIERDDHPISLPKATTTIEVGDRLICYGNLQNLGRLFDTPGDDPKSAS